MAVPLATSSDVATKLQRALSPAEEAAADVYIREASAIIRRRINGLDDFLTDGSIDSDLAMGVVTDAVVRVLRNPSGVSMQSIGAESASWGNARSVGKVVITDEEIAQLMPVSASAAGGMAVGTATLAMPCWVQDALRYQGVPPWGQTARWSRYEVE